MKDVAKVIEDKRVAVIINEGWGSGWWTSHFDKELLFEPFIVDLIRERDAKTLEKEEFNEHLKDFLEAVDLGYIYVESYFENLKIEWVAQGSKFRIDEYDGIETIHLFENEEWLKA